MVPPSKCSKCSKRGGHRLNSANRIGFVDMILHSLDREIPLDPTENGVETCLGTPNSVHILVPGASSDYICVTPAEAIELFASICDKMPANIVKGAIDSWNLRNT